jgi:hypothetical protein
MPEYTHMDRPVAYVKIGKVEGNVQGQRYNIPLPEGIPQVWSPEIFAARLNAEAQARKEAEKERKRPKKPHGRRRKRN